MRHPEYLAMDRQIYAYVVIGLINTLIYAMLVTLLITGTKASSATAHAIAFPCTALLSYFMHARWSFSQRARMVSLTRFLIVALLGQAMATGLGWLTDTYQQSYLLGIILVIAIVTPITFIMNKFWAFERP